MKVADLRKMLKSRNLPTVGTKTDLITRLELDNKSKEDTTDQPTTKVVDVAEDVLLDDDDEEDEDDDQLLAGEDDSNESTTNGQESTKKNSQPKISTSSAGKSPAHKTGGSEVVVIDESPSPPPTKRVKLNRNPVQKVVGSPGKGTGATPVTADAALGSKILKTQPPPQEDRIKLREMKFGTIPGQVSAGQDSAVLKKRNERFGVKPSGQPVDPDKLAKRKERFGVVAPAGAPGNNAMDEKKAKRAIRFK